MDSRKIEDDKKYIEQYPPPSDALELQDFRVNGHAVTYRGEQVMAFRVDVQGGLIAFAGIPVRITVDGRETIFADAPFAQVAWSPVPEVRRVGGGTLVQIMAHGTVVLRIPAGASPESVEPVAEGPAPGTRGAIVPSRWEGDALVFTVAPEISGAGSTSCPRAASATLQAPSRASPISLINRSQRLPYHRAQFGQCLGRV